MHIRLTHACQTQERHPPILHTAPARVHDVTAQMPTLQQTALEVILDTFGRESFAPPSAHAHSHVLAVLVVDVEVNLSRAMQVAPLVLGSGLHVPLEVARASERMSARENFGCLSTRALSQEARHASCQCSAPSTSAQFIVCLRAMQMKGLFTHRAIAVRACGRTFVRDSATAARLITMPMCRK